MKKLFLFLIALSFFGQGMAQNPFAELGYQPRVATASNGKFNEFHDQDSVVRIGSVLFNVNSRRIVGFVERDSVASETSYEVDVVSRWISPDPLSEMRNWLSPYNFVQNNPIMRIDPDGQLDDWYLNQDGESKWFANSSAGFSDAEGNSWSNIGTELIEFDGTTLTYNWQSGNESNGFQLHSETYSAVSGQGIDPTGYWNQTRIFDYSEGRQKIRDVGPVPDGNYSINKKAFVPGSNESGFQAFGDISLAKRLASPLGFSNWPGGTSSWGNYRWKLQNEGSQTFGRDNFYLHGGSVWGSRGCIDCGSGIDAFTQSFMNRDLGNNKIFIKVRYPENQRFQIQNNPTNRGLNIIGR